MAVSLFAATNAAFAQTPSTPSSQTGANSEATNQAAVQAAYEKAVGLLQQGKAADALAVIDAAVRGGARDASLYNLKGLAASELGRDAEAEESFRAVIRLSPKAAMGYNNLGVLLSKLGRYEDAARNFREAHARDPQNFTALLGLGTALAALRKFDEAAAYLERALVVRPGDFQAGYEWAHALYEAKKLEAAKKVLSKVAAPEDSDSAVKYYSLSGAIAEALHDDAGAARAYRHAYAISPSYDIYLILVQSSLAAGATDDARAASLAKLPAAPENLNANQNLAIGLLFLGHDAAAEAIPLLERVLRQDEFNETATLNLAVAYKDVGRSADAIELTQRALEKRPSGALYNMLAELDEGAGKYVEAVGNYQRAVEAEPTNEDYYFDLGMEYLSHFTFGPALEVYRVGTQKFPRVAREYLGLAFSHYAVREYPQAADAFTTALEIDPESPAVLKAWNTVLSSLSPADWAAILPRLRRLAAGHSQNADLAFYYGAALFRAEFSKGPEGHLDEAAAFLEKAVKLRPDFAAARIELAGLYAAQKEDQKAVDEYIEAIREDPRADTPHYRLGQIYRQMNKLDLAGAELARYQELSRAHEEEIKRSRSAIQQFVLATPSK
ncbi:MAG TPA: tetratricopeptide repeat protein [Terriglobales bacterium]|jgi:tetratricopeptide (TPR) repeat protein|nr:tetratricopeptide repeat protein [Terriglobales bacterium]